MRHIRISFLWNVKKVYCRKHVLNFLLPTSRHFFSRVDKLEVLNDLERAILGGSHMLQWTATLHYIFVAALTCGVVIFWAYCPMDRVVLRWGRSLSNRCDFQFTSGSWSLNCLRPLEGCGLADRQLSLTSALAAAQVTLFELVNAIQPVLPRAGRRLIHEIGSIVAAARRWELWGALQRTWSFYRWKNLHSASGCRVEFRSGRILGAKVSIARADHLTGEVFMHDHVLLLCRSRYGWAARLMMNVPSVHILCFIIAEKIIRIRYRIGFFFFV